MTEIVIGSGPAGIAAISALLARGRKVCLVDVGRDLEPDAAARLAVLSRVEPADWPDGAVDAYKAPQLAGGEEIMRFGSRFAVAPAESALADAGGTALRSSDARGGFGNVWGASVLPWRTEDMAGWPVSPGALDPHYRAVSDIVPIAGNSAEYDALLPTPLAFAPHLEPTPQGAALLARFAESAKRMAALGMVAGSARQAVTEGCRRCGLCLYGCPYGLIFSPRPIVARLIADGRIDHREGGVRRIEETGDGVRLTLTDGGLVTGARVFVAAGVLGTARIGFASFPGLDGREVALSESRHAFLPFLSRWAVPGTGKGPLHTLVQAFVEIVASEVSPYLVHSQLYGWNDFYARELAQNYGKGIGALNPLFAALARRLIVSQTFLHSDHCPTIALSPAKGDADGRLVARVVGKDGFEATLARARRRLAEGLRAAGLYAIAPAARIGAPGSSFHLGSSFPMREAPEPGETDTLGRPAGMGRVHIVDASVLPSIPASTITLSAMANAHRIAANAPE